MRLLTSVIFVTVSAFADSDDGTFKATLTGSQEIPVNLSRASGDVSVKINESPRTLEVTLRYSGLSSTPQQAHLHLGAFHQNGPVVLALCGVAPRPACPANGTELRVTIQPADILGLPAQGLTAGDFDALARAIGNGIVYANVHTTNYPGGEIRGQLGRGRGSNGDDEDDDDDDNPGKGKGKDK